MVAACVKTQSTGRSPQYLFPEGARFGNDNLVLHATGRRHVVNEFSGPLSIKSVVSGKVTWIVDGTSLAVDENSFLVLNEGQKYSMDMDELRPMETCCAFFSHRFVEHVAQDATTSVQASLDTPARVAPALHFLSRLHQDSSGVVLTRLRSLAERCAAGLQPSSFEEDFLVLSETLVLLYDEITAQISRVPATKASTRKELFRRLQLAREYMHSSADQSISLQVVAREACLSQYHLHRAFTKVFAQTPHTYLTTLRLERAYAILKSGRPVTETCLEVGFASLSAFSRLFRTRYGFSPSSVNKRH